MSTNAPDPNKPHKAGGLWARMFGAKEEESEQDELQENQEPIDMDETPENEDMDPSADELPPVAQRVEPADGESEPPPAIPSLSLNDPDTAVAPAAPVEDYESVVSEEALDTVAMPVEETPPPPPVDNLETAVPVEEPPPAIPIAEEPAPPTAESAPPAVEEPPVAEVPEVTVCPACGADRQGTSDYCGDCGWMFSSAPAAPAALSSNGGVSSPMNADFSNTGHTAPAFPVKERYQVGDLISQKAGLFRYQGTDLQGNNGQGTPVLILAAALPPKSEPEVVEGEAVAEEDSLDDDNLDDFIPTFDEPLAVAEISTEGAAWPSIGWEKNLLDQANHPAVPKVLDHFIEGEFEYLIEESPQGQILWDAWDDPDISPGVQYGYLIQLAEGMHALHQGGAILEGLNPDMIRVTDDGQAMIADLSHLLPIPLPENALIQGTLYTAPELVLDPASADARADIYSFGALIYSLEYLHHPLEEKDFERQFHPHAITDRYPDVHPAFNRLIMKTFCRDLNLRFPTDEASREDASGFTELIYTLKVCQRTFESTRLDIAAWTTTGVVRTGNEDAFAFLHAVESRQDELFEYGLILLADGMGGYEAGEVAAAMAIQELRKFVLDKPMFAALAGKDTPEEGVFDLEECKTILLEALKHANKTVYTASRAPGQGKRGMGCTAEIVYIDDQNLVVGHVGDSRTYHLTNGTIKQLTRDHTLVNRLVELGMLTAEEAEDHDRKNELQQAIGGQPEVEPGLYHARLRRGDWVLVCSDGITGHIPDSDLEKMLLRESSTSAEDAARRLVNLVNLRGATDNSTVVIVRAS